MSKEYPMKHLSLQLQECSLLGEIDSAVSLWSHLLRSEDRTPPVEITSVHLWRSISDWTVCRIFM